MLTDNGPVVARLRPSRAGSRNLALTLALTSAMLGGCASAPASDAERQALTVSCRGTAQCDRYWQRALQWTEQNSYYPVKNSTGWAILTDPPSDYRTELSYRIIRWPRDDGGQDIVFDAKCSAFLPCIPQPAAAFAKFSQYLTAP